MENEEDPYRKFRLLTLLREAERKAAEVQDRAQDMVQSARVSRDLAQSMAKIVDNAPTEFFTPEKTNSLCSIWDSHNAAAERAARTVELTHYGAIAQANLAYSTSTASLSAATALNLPSLRSQLANIVKEEIFKFDQYVAPYAKLEDVSRLMRKFRLDISSDGTKDAHTLLLDAQLALTTADEPTSALIQLRECIHATVSSLLRRRPQQEATGNISKQVVSIGTQCGIVPLPENHFVVLGEAFKNRIDQLSTSKQRSMERDEIMAEFRAGLQLLTALLESLDPTKVRA